MPHRIRAVAPVASYRVRGVTCGVAAAPRRAAALPLARTPMRLSAFPANFKTPYAADETRTCYRCGFETTEVVKRCAECGYPLRSGKAVRRLGWVLVVIGTALVGFMGWLSFVVGEIVYRTREGLPGTATFTGDAEDLALITGAFGLVIAIGVGAVFGGAWQIRYGRPNRKVMAVAFFLVSLLLLARPILRMLNAS